MTRRRRAFLGLFALCLLSSTLEAAANHSWKTYLNARFGTVATYPGDLFRLASEADNGDGATFTGRNGAELRIFGSWNVLDRTPASYLAFLKEDPDHANISYQSVKPKLLTVSGTRKSTIFYERYDFGDPKGAIHALVFTYPAASRQLYDPVIPQMAKSLHWEQGWEQKD